MGTRGPGRLQAARRNAKNAELVKISKNSVCFQRPQKSALLRSARRGISTKLFNGRDAWVHASEVFRDRYTRPRALAICLAGLGGLSCAALSVGGGRRLSNHTTERPRHRVIAGRHKHRVIRHVVGKKASVNLVNTRLPRDTRNTSCASAFAAFALFGGCKNGDRIFENALSMMSRIDCPVVIKQHAPPASAGRYHNQLNRGLESVPAMIVGAVR